MLAGLPFVRADAGHEMPFYPSYYPQEITISTLPAATAAARFEKKDLHAYLGAGPFSVRPVPAHVGSIESLGSYVVLTFDARSAVSRSRETRCAAAQEIIGRLPARDGAWVFHPYPVTPYHPDYLHHLDLAQAAIRAHPRTPAPGLPPGLKVGAKGKLAEALLGAGARGPGARRWDAVLEEIAPLVPSDGASLHGGVAYPWIKEGWFQIFRIAGASALDPAIRRGAGETARRLTNGSVERSVDRINLERALVSGIVSGCERVVAGYTVRREFFNNDYSAGVENVAGDSLTGLQSAIFLRTVKLKDFPWNGWLTLGAPERPIAAWNPVAGFSDVTGGLIWSAVSDPALFPEPYNESWTENRVRLATPPVLTAAPIAVPGDALLPESGTGIFRAVGEGKTARVKLTYRVLTSAFHDGTRMNVADALYGLAFSFRWGGGPESDPDVRRATEMTRQWLAGLKVVKVDTDVLRFGEVTMKYDVPVVDVYLAGTLPDPFQLATVSPPWSAVPWHVLALMEEAVTRRLGAFSAEQARRRGVPWLDVVRDPKLKERLVALVAELEARAYVPLALKPFVTDREARARWAALGRFAAEHRHFLVTSGPYQLHAWSADRVVLRVVRDFSYPLGVGSFNRYAVPLRGFIGRAEVQPGGVEVHAEAERVERFAREYRIVTEPVGGPAAQKDKGIAVVCRYVAVAPDGTIVRQGSMSAAGSGLFTVSREGLPGGTTLLLALEVNGNRIAPHTRVVRLE